MADHHDGHLPKLPSIVGKTTIFSDKAQMVVLDPADRFLGSPCELASLKRIEISEISLVSGDKSSDKSSDRFSKFGPVFWSSWRTFFRETHPFLVEDADPPGPQYEHDLEPS